MKHFVTISFPDKKPNGDSISTEDIENWFYAMSKAMQSFTGVELELIGVTPVTGGTKNEPENGSINKG
jgi:hypothetical protein